MENLTKITKCQNCGHKLEKDELVWCFACLQDFIDDEMTTAAAYSWY